ncbi:MAG: winged helix-turn-helix domain-containing protein, partial [Pyrinomonadaceae bacterium]|nr:winged helix-turn-helix domain-containing protein [Pyrinomonadaceae bacterium]
MSNIEGTHKSLRDGGLYAFAGFRLDTAAGLLTHSGEQVKLAPKVYQLLVYMVENRDRVVSRDEIFSAVWPDAFVEDNALSFTVSQLRKSLAAQEPNTAFIQTVPRRGFRFVAEVTESNAGLMKRKPSGLIVEKQVVEETWIEEVIGPASADRPLLTEARNPWRQTLILAVAAVVVLTSGFVHWQFAFGPDRPTRSDVRSIAVLPLGTFESDGVDEPLRMRITDSLITKLGNIDSLSVRPTISVASFKRETTDPLAFGRRLEVDAILDGRVHKDADKLRVTIQLISVATGDNLWSDQFDGRADRLLDLQDAISLRLIDALDMRLSSGEKANFQKRPTLVAEAYEEYLRGRYFWTTRSKDGLSLIHISE